VNPLVFENRGLSLCHDDVDFARCIVNRGGSTFGRIAVCVKLAAESACLFGYALSGIEIHHIPAGTDTLVRWVALGVRMLPDSGRLRGTRPLQEAPAASR